METARSKAESYYGRVNWEDIDGIANSGQVTFSLHAHDQERNRMKGSSGIAQGGDFQYFNLMILVLPHDLKKISWREIFSMELNGIMKT